MLGTSIQPTLAALSLYEEARREAERHKWIESQKRGRDLGVAALSDWFCKHWPPYCRAKCLEHLRGSQQWREFGEDRFGQLGRQVVEEHLLVDRVLDRFSVGQENLHIIVWALDWGIETEEVVTLLTVIDINRARLEPPSVQPN